MLRLYANHPYNRNSNHLTTGMRESPPLTHCHCAEMRQEWISIQSGFLIKVLCLYQVVGTRLLAYAGFVIRHKRKGKYNNMIFHVVTVRVLGNRLRNPVYLPSV